MATTHAAPDSVTEALSADGSAARAFRPLTGIGIILIGELEVVGLELIGLIRRSRQEPG